MCFFPTCHLRIDRAEKRLGELKGELAAYKEANESCEIKVDGHAASMTGWPPQPPPEIGITAGEVVYNLRAALDYLVFELAFRDSFGISQDEINMRTQFPIEDKPEGFKGRIDPIKRRGGGTLPNWLTGVSPDHIAAIEELQPYRGVNWTKLLRDLSNEDKHRMFPLTGYVVPVGTINIGGTEEEAKALGGYRKPGDMNMYYPAPINVIFATFASGGIAESLEILQAEVRAVIDSFELDFERASHEGAPS
jgi:hypothetical protein